MHYPRQHSTNLWWLAAKCAHNQGWLTSFCSIDGLIHSRGHIAEMHQLGFGHRAAFLISALFDVFARCLVHGKAVAHSLGLQQCRTYAVVSVTKHDTRDEAPTLLMGRRV